MNLRAHSRRFIALSAAGVLFGMVPMAPAYAQSRPWSEPTGWRPLAPSDLGGHFSSTGRSAGEFVAPAPRGDLRGDIVNNSRQRDARDPQRAPHR